MALAYVGLGANLGNPQAQVRAAMEAIAALARVRVTARSPLYVTPPWGVLEQPDFVNAVVAVRTTLSPHALLERLGTIEREAGRRRDGPRWGPRTLDLDLLLYDQLVLDEADLHVPHARLAERAFVLLPLADIAAGAEVPGHGRVADLLRHVDTRGCRRLDTA